MTKYLTTSAVVSIEPKYIKRSSAYEQKQVSSYDKTKVGIGYVNETTRFQLEVRVLTYDKVRDKEVSLTTYTLNVLDGTNLIDMAMGNKDVFITALMKADVVVASFTSEDANPDIYSRVNNEFIHVIKPHEDMDAEGFYGTDVKANFNGRTSYAADALIEPSDPHDIVDKAVKKNGHINNGIAKSYFVSKEVGTVPVPELTTSLDDVNKDRFDNAKKFTHDRINDELRAFIIQTGNNEVNETLMDVSRSHLISDIGDASNLITANNATDVVESTEGNGPLQTIVSYAGSNGITETDIKTFTVRDILVGNIFIRTGVDPLSTDMTDVSIEDIKEELIKLIGDDGILESFLETHRTTSTDGNHFDGVSENGLTGSGMDLLISELIEKSIIIADYANNNGNDNFVTSLLEIVNRIKDSRRVISMSVSFTKDSIGNINVDCQVTNASYGTYEANNLRDFSISDSIINDIVNENIFLPNSVSYISFTFSDGVGISIEGTTLTGEPYNIETVIEQGFLSQTQTVANINFAGE